MTIISVATGPKDCPDCNGKGRLYWPGATPMSGICRRCKGGGTIKTHVNTIVGPDDMPEEVEIVQEPEETVGQVLDRVRDRKLTKPIEVTFTLWPWEPATKLFVVFCILTVCFVVWLNFKYGIS